MAQFIPFELDDGTTILVESSAGGPVRAGTGDVIGEARRRFADAIRVVKPLCAQIKRDFQTMEGDETEVTFALKTTGELDFAVAKLGAEANFQITVKWKNSKN